MTDLARRSKLVLAAACLMAMMRPGPGHAGDLATLPGNVAPWVAGAERAAAADSDSTVTIAVHLALRDTPGLKALVASISKPASPSYGRYLTPDQFRARFAPDAADVAAVQAMLRDAGMAVIRTGATGGYVEATATVDQLRRAFHVTQDIYRLGKHLLRANREAPSVPAALAGKISFIEGLDDSGTLRQPQHRALDDRPLRPPPGLEPQSGPGPQSGRTPLPVASYMPSPYCDEFWGDLKATLSTAARPYGAHHPWQICGYTPQQIRAAYGIDRVAQTGDGVRVAILDAYASPTIAADANRYAAKHGLPPLTSANFRQIIPAGVFRVNPDDPCHPYDWWVEESLDVEAVHSAAPGARIIYVGANGCNVPLDVAAIDTVEGQVADIISNSWSENGEFEAQGSIAVIDGLLMQAAAYGISVLFGSGDEGDLSQVNGVASGSLPADSAYATAVGGTSLALRSAQPNKSEWGWGEAVTLLANPVVQSGTSVTTSGPGNYAYFFGAGGGPSLLEPQPDYQSAVVPSILATQTYSASGERIPLSPARRVTPDVSMVADPATGFVIGESFSISPTPADNANCTPTGATTEYCESPEGGTSLATPLFAGVFALVDQTRFAHNAPALGFANPWLYGLPVGHSGLKAAPLNDVRAPATPTALLRWTGPSTNVLKLFTVGSEPSAACPRGVCEGLNDVFNVTTPGYDVVTGLGVPWVPLLVTR